MTCGMRAAICRPAELDALLEATRTAGERRGLSGEDRASGAAKNPDFTGAFC